jgi:hypothetical protein
MKAQTTKLHEAYENAHIAAMIKAQKLIEKIQDYPNPDGTEANWGHVGDLQHYVEKLEELLGERG